jgi:hypothetical protein
MTRAVVCVTYAKFMLDDLPTDQRIVLMRADFANQGEALARCWPEVSNAEH